MNQLPQRNGGQAGRPHDPTSIDLILQARALRHRWFAAALARLSADLVRACAEVVAQAGRTRRPAVPGRLRPATE